MSKWTHSQCERCWNEAHLLMNPIAKRDDGEKETCCFCNKEHTSGIYVRFDYKKLMCKGLHEEKEVISDMLVTTENEPDTERMRVIIGSPMNRLVDGFIARSEGNKLDDILNSKKEYQEKIDAIKAIVDESETYEEAQYEHDKSKAGT